MGVFVVFFGRRGVVGFNGCCSGVRSGDGGFMLACSSGRSGGGGYTIATSQRPVCEKVRPAWPVVGLSVTKFAQRSRNSRKSAFYGVLGEFCTG
jgi:hypothetical protein